MSSTTSPSAVDLLEATRSKLTSIIGNLSVMERTFQGNSWATWITETKSLLVDATMDMNSLRAMLDDDVLRVSPPGSLSPSDNRKRPSLEERLEKFDEEGKPARTPPKVTRMDRVAAIAYAPPKHQKRHSVRVLVPKGFSNPKCKIDCCFCGLKHYSDQCGEYSLIKAREELSKSRHICRLCYHVGRQKHDCPRLRQCRYCDQSGHSEAFCPYVKKTVWSKSKIRRISKEDHVGETSSQQSSHPSGGSSIGGEGEVEQEEDSLEEDEEEDPLE